MGLLTRVGHSSANTQLDANLVARADGQDLGAAGVGEGALVADDVLAIGMRAVADVLGRVRREFDGVVGCLAGELPDILEGGRGAAAGAGDVEEVVGGSTLRDGADDKSGGLHGNGYLPVGDEETKGKTKELETCS